MNVGSKMEREREIGTEWKKKYREEERGRDWRKD